MVVTSRGGVDLVCKELLKRRFHGRCAAEHDGQVLKGCARRDGGRRELAGVCEGGNMAGKLDFLPGIDAARDTRRVLDRSDGLRAGDRSCRKRKRDQKCGQYEASEVVPGSAGRRKAREGTHYVHQP